MTGLERHLSKLLGSHIDAAFAPGFSQRVMRRIDSAHSFYVELRQSFVRLSAAAVLVIAGLAFANARVAADESVGAWPAALGMPSSDIATVVNVASGAAELT